MSGHLVDNVTDVMAVATTDDNVTDVMAGGGGGGQWFPDWWFLIRRPTKRQQELTALFKDIRNYSHCTVAWLGLFLNGLIILVLLLKNKSKEQTVNLLLTALALSDIFSLFSSMDFTVFFATDYTKSLTLTKVGCELVQYITNVARDCSSYIILTFTVDRFLSVKFPLKKSLWVTRRRVLVLISLFIPVFAAMESYVPYYLELEHLWADSYTCMAVYFKELARMTAILRLTFGFVVPAVFVAILNILIIHQLRRWHKERASMIEGSEQAKKEQNSAAASHNRSLTALLVAVSTFSFAISLPRVVVLYCATIWDGYHEWTGDFEFKMVVDFTDALALLNYCCNFFFYCLSGSQFRNDLFETPARICNIFSGRGQYSLFSFRIILLLLALLSSVCPSDIFTRALPNQILSLRQTVQSSQEGQYV